MTGPYLLITVAGIVVAFLMGCVAGYELRRTREKVDG